MREWRNGRMAENGRQVIKAGAEKAKMIKAGNEGGILENRFRVILLGLR